ncbi:unnamed protein product [Parnassius mnemosyne]|uniref:Uncharacterized protein n=1 Tax=Parnassius mnemosyne TaxID=213953 RepID=A0AAV1L1A1_9NEOP
MQENNFETIISTWRRLSGETVEPVESTALVSMSGDSSGHQAFKKKEETDLLVPEKTKVPVTMAAVVSDGLPPDIGGNIDSDEKKEFIQHDKEESKEAAGDSNEKSDKDDDYLENMDPRNKVPVATSEKDKVGDKVDSVYLRPPPPHKARSAASTVEEEGCGMKCLYYTLECCDCVLM